MGRFLNCIQSAWSVKTIGIEAMLNLRIKWNCIKYWGPPKKIFLQLLVPFAEVILDKNIEIEKLMEANNGDECDDKTLLDLCSQQVNNSHIFGFA